MAVRIDITNADAIARRMQARTRAIVDRATPAALNRAAQGTRTDGTRAAAAEMGVPQRTIRAGVRIIKASRASPRAAVIFAGRPIPLIQFNARQTKPGVTASAYGVRRVYRGTFIASLRSTSTRQVFTRKGAARLPIKKVWGPGLAGTVGKPAFRAMINAKAAERVRVEMRRAIAAASAGSLGRRS